MKKFGCWGFLLLMVGIVMAVDHYAEIQRLHGIQRFIASTQLPGNTTNIEALISIEEFIGFGIDSGTFVLKIAIWSAVIGGLIGIASLFGMRLQVTPET